MDRATRLVSAEEDLQLRRSGLRLPQIPGPRGTTVSVCPRARLGFRGLSAAPILQRLWLPERAARAPIASSPQTVRHAPDRQDRERSSRRGPSCSDRALPESERLETPTDFPPELPAS